LANLAATIGNEGFYYPPHLIRSVEDEAWPANENYTAVRNTGVEASHFRLVKEAMLNVFEGEGGTARYYKSPAFQAAGKTGTVQNPHGKDHSMFLAFAPFEKPQIAISVIVENAGYGSTWAAPIASLMMEQYLTGSVNRTTLEQRIKEADLNQ
jgi:penicillin-binding protein 2